MLVVNPRTFYEKTSDQTARNRYEAAVVGMKSYMSAVISPKLKRARMEDALESRKAGTSGKGLFVTNSGLLTW